MPGNTRVPAVLAATLLVSAGCSTALAPSSPGPSAPPPTSLASPSTPTATPGPTPIAILDGEPWVVYAWPRVGGDGIWALFLMRPDGTDAHEIAADVRGEKRGATWSPDGRRLAFVVKDSAHPEGWIWTSNADGTGAAPIAAGAAECPVGMFHPAWSPDGTKLAVVCYPNGDDHESVAVVDLAAGTVVRVADFVHPEAVTSAPTWSPDGRTLAFEILEFDVTVTFQVGSVIATVPAAGGEIRRLTSPERFMVHPDWRPDGSEIVMYDLDPKAERPSNLYVIKPDGTGLRQLTHATDGHVRIQTPRWTPDGRRITVSLVYAPGPDFAFAGDVRLAFIDGAGGDPVLISERAGKYPELRPTP